ncbi:MAG: HD domain-containing protein [Nitrospirales bacterium]|nr:HD domain-containing protein [Nitrospirales bacterium]
MNSPSSEFQLPFDGLALMADPIHEYIMFTVPFSSPDNQECTEKDLIDSPWMQRLRSIYQLQSARWVYPSAEHSRFQHSLGTMHVAGRLAKHLYPTLKQLLPDLPSSAFIEELLRVTALLHDIGHGPFCHFFDHHFLAEFGLTHERIGQVIIRDHLAPLIRGLRRSPSGMFEPGEQLDPHDIAFLILKDPQKDGRPYPAWLAYLQPLIGGIFTADNFDYVLRDSYMCGVAVGPVDLTRLIHYTLMTPQGLTIHRTGLPAFQMFLNARLYLYSNVYYHRTTRAIDLHLAEIFRATMAKVFPKNPLDQMEAYQNLTDWSLIETVRTWTKAKARTLQHLGQEWKRVLSRNIKWKMAYMTLLPIHQVDHHAMPLQAGYVESCIRASLPSELKQLDFRVDLAHQDPRPINLLNMGGFQIYVYDPGTHTVEKETLQDFFEYLPVKILQCRIFCEDHTHDRIVSQAAARVMTQLRQPHSTEV